MTPVYGCVTGITVSCGSDGVMTFRELTKSSASCYSLSPYISLTWSLTTLSGQQVSLGTCVNETSCTSQHQAVTAVSHASITFNATRDMAGTLVCSEVFSNGTIVSANCTQDIACKKDLPLCFIISLTCWNIRFETLSHCFMEGHYSLVSYVVLWM